MFSLGTRKDVVALLIFDKIRGKNLYLEMTCNAANFLIDRDFGKKLTQRLPKIVIQLLSPQNYLPETLLIEAPPTPNLLVNTSTVEES